MVVDGLQAMLIGMAISFSGALPLGNLNITAMQISAHETVGRAILFACGATVVELVYLRITLAVIDNFSVQQSLFYAFRIVSVGVLLAMAWGSFRSAGGTRKNRIVENHIHRFCLGWQ